MDVAQAWLVGSGLLTCLALAAGRAAAEEKPLFRFDFGRGPAAEGTTKVGSTTVGPGYSYLWRGEGVGDRDRKTDDPLTGDLVFGTDIEFLIGLDNGAYRIRVVLGDASYAHGPFDILVQGKPVAERVQTRKGEFASRDFEAKVEAERLSIRFRAAEAAANAAVVAMEIFGPAQKETHPAIDNVPSRTVPAAEAIDALGEPDPRAALRTLCDWLVAHQRDTGVWSGSWYQTSYPVRALLAGHDIFGERRYLDAATRCLDKLPPEQLPNHSFASGFRNKPTAQLTEAEAKSIMAGTTNTADVGCIAACLSIAAPYVDAARRTVYLDAARRYADGYAAQWQLPSGGFTNAQCRGIRCTSEYSVATGTQAMNFAALHAATGERRYLDIATRAAQFLLANWLEDGRPIHHRWNSPTKAPQPVTSFGDIYYAHGGIQWVFHHSPDPAFRKAVERVYRWHIFGEQGLLQARENAVWWPLGHPWSNAKATATPCVLMLTHREFGKSEALATAIHRAIAFLATPAHQRQVGVMTDPAMPWSRYTVEATGFAGLSLAERVSPGVVFLRSARAQRALAAMRRAAR